MPLNGNEEAARRPHTALVSALLLTIALVASIWLLRTAHVVFMPLTAAIFLVLLVYPVQRAVCRAMPRWLNWVGTLVAALAVVGAVAVLGGLVWLAISIAIDQLPQYREEAQQFWQSFVDWAQRHDLHLRGEEIGIGSVAERVAGVVRMGITGIWSVLAMLAVIFFFMLLILVEVVDWRDKFKNTLSSGAAEDTIGTVADIADRVRQYVLIRTGISALSGLAAGLWIWIVGVDFPLLWGVLVFALNYIPYVGSAVAMVPPTLLALIQHGPWWAVLTFGGLIAGEQTIASFIEPQLEGHVLQLSPTVLLFSILFWGWMWGIAGAILAVPLAVAIAVIFARVDVLRPVGALLGEEPESSQEMQS